MEYQKVCCYHYRHDSLRTGFMRNIQTFLAVAESGSFSKAAERLYLTQPTVTKRIAALEMELNNRLFRRTGHAVILTDAGNSFLGYAREIEHQWLNAQHVLSEFSNEVKGTLRVCCNTNTGLYVLPGLMKQYKQRCPKVKMELNFLHSPNVKEVVLDHQADIGFATRHGELPETLDAIPVKQERLIPLAHPDYRATRESDQRQILNRLPALTSSPENIYYHHLQDFLRYQAINCEQITHINMLETIKKMVEAGIGWSLLPENMKNASLSPLNLPARELMVETICILRNDEAMSKPTRQLIDLVCTYNTTR